MFYHVYDYEIICWFEGNITSLIYHFHIHTGDRGTIKRHLYVSLFLVFHIYASLIMSWLISIHLNVKMFGLYEAQFLLYVVFTQTFCDSIAKFSHFRYLPYPLFRYFTISTAIAHKYFLRQYFSSRYTTQQLCVPSIFTLKKMYCYEMRRLIIYYHVLNKKIPVLPSPGYPTSKNS